MSDGIMAVGSENGSSVATEERRTLHAEISREMVRIYKDQFGRGPTKAKTGFADADTLVITLEDSLTPAERHMVALGEHQRLREFRMFFQHAAQASFRESVERLTGRRVRAFVSGIDPEHDVATEVFHLEPR